MCRVCFFRVDGITWFPWPLTSPNSSTRIGRQRKEKGLEKVVRAMGSTTSKASSEIGASYSSRHIVSRVNEKSAPLTSACSPTIKRLRLLLAADAGR